MIFDCFNSVAKGAQAVSMEDLAAALQVDEEEKQQRLEAMDLNDDKMISHKEFKEFHWCLSANFMSDDKFIASMKQMWGC